MTTLLKPTPPPTDDTVQAISPDTKERVLGGIGGFLSGATGAGGSDRGTPFHDSDLGRALEDHHSQRLAEAQMHQASVAKAGAALAQIQQGINPETGQKFNPNDPQDQVQMEQMRQFYEKQFNAAHDLFVKTAGVNKETKGALAKGKMLLDHFLGIGQPAQQAAQGGGGGGPTPPPGDTSEATPVSKAAPSPTNPDTRTVGQIASQETPVPAEPYDERSRARLSRTQEQMDYDRNAGRWKDQEKYLHDLKMEEIAATGKARAIARAQNTKRPVPINAPIDIMDARDSGQEFMDQQGHSIDLSKVPDHMLLQPVLMNVPQVDETGQVVGEDWQTRYVLRTQRDQFVNIGGVKYAVAPYGESMRLPGDKSAATAVGPAVTKSNTATRDPVSGLVTSATKTPATPGMYGGEAALGNAATPPTQNVPRGTPGPQRTPMTPPPTGGTGKALPKGIVNASPEQINDEGHIPAELAGKLRLPDGTIATGGVIEVANQLIDGMDVKEEPGGRGSGLKTQATQLARAMGWKRGMFSPRELRQVAQTATFIKDLEDSGALKVLDNKGVVNRNQLAQLLTDPEKQGLVGRGMSSLATAFEDKQQAKYVGLFNQLSQVLGGMAPLTRNGRMTLAMFNRMRLDLPHPLNTRDSEDAKYKLGLLKEEINTALKYKGDKDILDALNPESKGRLTPPPKGERKPLTELIPTQ